MTDQENCPECGYPQSRYHRDIAFDCLCTGDIVCEGRALKRAKVELSALRLEVAAWRALNDWGCKEFCDVTASQRMSTETESPRYSMRAHVYGGTHATGPYWYGEGPTPQAAAVALARQLHLIPAEPDAESREGREP